MIDPHRKNDVLIGFCHNGTVATVFMNSFLAAFAEDASRPQRRLIEYHDAAGPYIHDNRARIAKYFLDHTDYQWLWMLDNDIQFPADSLYRMLDTAYEHSCGILGAAYWNGYIVTDEGGSRNTQHLLSWLVYSNGSIGACESLPDTDDPVQVTAVGMGCTLIHRSVLQDVSDLHPGDPWDTFSADVLRVEDGTAMRMGEDVTFCLRARQAGHLTWGMPSLVVEHFKPYFMLHGRRETWPLAEDPSTSEREQSPNAGGQGVHAAI